MVGRFGDAAQQCCVVLQASNIDVHNAIAAAERYHAPLRRVYNVVRLDDVSLSPTLALQLAVKAINDTMGPTDLVQSLLVFGCFSRFPVYSSSPTQARRKETVAAALLEGTR